MQSTNHKISIVLLMMVITGVIASEVTVCNSAESRTIVQINGNFITEDDLVINENQAYEEFKQKNKKAPSAKELEIAILGAKKRIVISKINSIIKNKYIKDQGIIATPEEAKASFEAIYPKLKEDSASVLAAEQTYFNKLYKAIRYANRHPEKVKEVYESELKGIMGYETWLSLVKYYDTPEKIEIIKKGTPTTVEDIYKSSALTMQSWLLNKKFEDSITKDVSVSDMEIKRYYETQMVSGKDKVDYSIIKPRLQKQLLANKRAIVIYEWWQKQYRELTIKIIDDRFADIPDMLLSSTTERKSNEQK
jgi:hypothetical protein